ncbi:MAG: SbmA/BacA-like family transporter [Deltaproteobacteria bacterium]|nr:SbmA/BacA-like family transporter [Deltaproteobacteria bacterium]
MRKKVLVNRETWDHFTHWVKIFLTAEQVGVKAKSLIALLIVFMLGINALNVLNSYVGRDFMTAIEDRNRSGFILMALFYIGVFAASTLTGGFYRYTEERLGLMWRQWATRRTILVYANKRVYYRLKMAGEIENPDQRIAEDIRAFTATTITFVLMLLNGTLTVVAFSGVLWSISPMLFMVSVLYAAAGTCLTYFVGRRLVRLNFDQADKEANFRAALIHLRSNAEPVALCRHEGRLIRLLIRNLGDLTENFVNIIKTSRNVNFCTTGYNWLIQIIPALIIAPLFIDGKVQFGVITQSAIAFGYVLGAFSLIVTQFQSISSFTAVLARLSALTEANGQAKAAEKSASQGPKDDEQVVYRGVTLRAPGSDRVLVRELTLAIPHGRQVLVCGSDDSTRLALFRATAGLWEVNNGHIVRPPLEKILFVTERPYLPPGSLRELFIRPWPEEAQPSEKDLLNNEFPEIRILEGLRNLEIDSILKRFGGMNTRQNWESVLTLSEQQLLVVVRVLLASPRFAFLEKPSTTLTPEQVKWVLGLLSGQGISCVIFEESSENVDLYDMVLELGKGGFWTYSPVEPAQILTRNYALAV